MVNRQQLPLNHPGERHPLYCGRIDAQVEGELAGELAVDEFVARASVKKLSMASETARLSLRLSFDRRIPAPPSAQRLQYSPTAGQFTLLTK
jgi:hypothetical protein